GSGLPNSAPRPLLPSTSTMSVVRSPRAARLARAAATVVLPTPPLPATMVTRAGGVNAAGSTSLPGRLTATEPGVRLSETLRLATVTSTPGGPERRVRHPDRVSADTQKRKVLVRAVRSRRFPLVGWRRQDYVAPQSKGDLAVSVQHAEDVWQAKAACRGPHTALFFPPSHFERKDDKE